MASDLEQIARFNISAAAPPRSFIREIDIVGRATERMKASLRWFSHYVPVELVREVVSSGEEARLSSIVVTLFL